MHEDKVSAGLQTDFPCPAMPLQSGTLETYTSLTQAVHLLHGLGELVLF